MKPHNNQPQIANPRFEIVGLEADGELKAERLRPVYPASERVKTRAIEAAMAVVLERGLALIDDHLEPGYRAERDLPSLADAYRMMHARRTRRK